MAVKDAEDDDYDDEEKTEQVSLIITLVCFWNHVCYNI